MNTSRRDVVSLRGVTMFNCTCCGIALTTPKFLNGKVYGSTCYAKITGKKTKKDKSIYIPAVRLSVDTSTYLPSATYLVEGIGEVKKHCAMPLAALNARGECLDDYLPMDALEIMDVQGKWCFKTICYSIPDKALIYKDQVVKTY